MNAYLPSLAKEAPEVVAIQEDISAQSIHLGTTHVRTSSLEAESPLAPLMPQNTPVSNAQIEQLKTKYDHELSRATSRISSLGIALGYQAGILLLIVALIPVTKLGGSTFSLRLAIGLSGIWWAGFSIPAALWLPGATHLTHMSNVDDAWEHGESTDKPWNSKREIVGAWIRLGNMLRWKEIKKLRNTFKYLAAWFLLSDGMYHLLNSIPKLTRG